MSTIKQNVKPSAFIVQLLATMTVAYLVTLVGFVFAWPSYTEDILKNKNTPLAVPMTSWQIDLLGSLSNIGALISTPFCGIAIDRLGRRYAAMIFGLPFVLFWAIISVTTNVYLVLFSMFFAGIGAGGQVVTTVYISEIVQDSIRGGLITTTVSGYFIGCLVSYVLGGYLSYHQVAYTHMTLSILYVVLLVFLKESPLYLLKNGREEDAAKSLAFYRRISSDSKAVAVEIQKMKILLDPSIDMILQNEDRIEASDKLLNEIAEKSDEPKERISQWRFLLNSPSSKRALFSCLFLMAMSVFMGTIILQVYAENILKQAVPSISSNLCSIFLALIFLVSSFISAMITDKLGRKVITTWSSLTSGICTLCVGLQLQFNFASPLVTVFLIFLYCFAFNIGASTTPLVLTAEAFLPEVKGLCNSLTLGCMWLSNFIVLISFRPIMDIIGLGPMFYIFSGVCVLTAAYSQFFLPETKGIPVDEIQLLFYKKRKTSIAHL